MTLLSCLLLWPCLDYIPMQKTSLLMLCPWTWQWSPDVWGCLLWLVCHWLCAMISKTDFSPRGMWRTSMVALSRLTYLSNVSLDTCMISSYVWAMWGMVPVVSTHLILTSLSLKVVRSGPALLWMKLVFCAPVLSYSSFNLASASVIQSMNHL